MEEIAFLGIQSRLEQHARVLSALHHAEPRILEGNIAIGCEVIALLLQWLNIHVATVDRVLVTALRMAQEEELPMHMLSSPPT